jgi:hypothetical protein
MRYCLRVVLDGERFAAADLSVVEEDHIFGRYGAEIHTEVPDIVAKGVIGNVLGRCSAPSLPDGGDRPG